MASGLTITFVFLGWSALAQAEPPAGGIGAVGQENLFVQVTSDAQILKRAQQKPTPQAQLLQADAQIAQCFQKRRSIPEDIGASVQKGLSAVQESLGHFMAKPPEIGKGLGVLGTKLLEAISEPVQEDLKGAAYESFVTGWTEFFEAAPEVIDSAHTHFNTFNENGNPEAIILGISEVLTFLTDDVMKLVPIETAQEIVKIVDSVADVLGAIGNSWVGFESGQETKAVEDLYFGIKAALGQLIPSEVQTDETFKIIFGTLDGVVGKLTENVLAFQKQIVEGAVCWKTQEVREKKRPSVCPDGFHWNGVQFCLPTPSLLQSGAAARSLEAAATHKADSVDSSAGGKKPNGAIVAVCVEGSDFSEKIGHWCYAACPDGMQVHSTQCKTKCHGAFPADDGAMMCGANPGVIAEAIMNMVLTVTNSLVTTGLNIAGMVKDGVDADSLVNTIQAFVDMGKPFAYSTCPISSASNVIPAEV